MIVFLKCSEVLVHVLKDFLALIQMGCREKNLILMTKVQNLVVSSGWSLMFHHHFVVCHQLYVVLIFNVVPSLKSVTFSM
jgi:hypothetical protein